MVAKKSDHDMHSKVTAFAVMAILVGITSVVLWNAFSGDDSEETDAEPTTQQEISLALENDISSGERSTDDIRRDLDRRISEAETEEEAAELQVLLWDVCRQQGDAACLEDLLTTAIEPSQQILMREQLADVYAEAGDAARALELIDEILDLIEDVPDNDEALLYYQGKQEALR